MRTLGIALLLLLAGSLQAAPVTWTVNATFYDGASLTGTFDYDADTQSLSNVDLAAEAGAIDDRSWPVITFDQVNNLAIQPVNQIAALSTPGTDGLSQWSLVLGFQESLAVGVGTIALKPGLFDTPQDSSMGTRSDFADFPYPLDGNFRHIVSGSVTAVPIPAAAWLFASGLGLLGWARRRQ